MASIYWLIVFVILIGIEMATLALTTVWFAGGAIVGFILSLFHMPTEVQLGAFVASSFFLLVLTRPFVSRYVNKTAVKTNVDSLVGRTARVVAQINNDLGTGTAVVGGQEWTARSDQDSVILEPDMMVVIREIRGVKLIVSKQEGK